MRKLLIVLLFPIFLYSFDIKNGEVKILNFDKNSTVYFEGKKIPTLQNPFKKGKFYTLLPIKYKEKLGQYTLLINGDKVLFKIKEGRYKKENIKVAKTKVKPNKKSLNEIYKEYKDAKRIYATFTPKRYWDKPFVQPLHSKITSNYGNARMFNHTLKSFHSGTDFRAKIDTPIKAANDGVVVIADKRYYAGGSVVIDHGEGLYTCYFHLSKILVHKNQKVKQYELIGLSGKSGRVNGPHLHFGIRLYSYAVNPLQFIKQINTLFKGVK
ncbi:MAG: M23 family metallopeptidase [Epsilonproteobacteria bacterium]|nr:M23 family metallopeptidase [Campylobacterota bacterium]